MIKEEIRVQDGKEYVVKKCPGCGKELLFKIREDTIRMHCACASCGRVMEVTIIGKDMLDMMKEEEELKNIKL